MKHSRDTIDFYTFDRIKYTKNVHDWHVSW